MRHDPQQRQRTQQRIGNLHTDVQRLWKRLPVGPSAFGAGSFRTGVHPRFTVFIDFQNSIGSSLIPDVIDLYLTRRIISITNANSTTFHPDYPTVKLVYFADHENFPGQVVTDPPWWDTVTSPDWQGRVVLLYDASNEAIIDWMNSKSVITGMTVNPDSTNDTEITVVSTDLTEGMPGSISSFSFFNIHEVLGGSPLFVYALSDPGTVIAARNRVGLVDWVICNASLLEPLYSPFERFALNLESVS